MKPNQHETFRTVPASAQLSLAITVALWLASAHSLPGQAVPDRMNYQGTLLKGDGTPVPATPTDVKFRIFNAAESGDLLWSRMHTVNPDTNGAFNVVLMDGGAEITSDKPAFTNLADVFTGAGSDLRYLELTVGDSTPIRPRQRFVASPYSFLARDALSLNQLPPQDFYLPPGMVVPFAGPLTNPPAGWLVCDGAPVSRTDYKRLFKAIGTAWGNGDGTSTFNLPDLRGMFLRGANGGSMDPVWSDPDTSTRVSRNGGNSGNNVGSVQTNAFTLHEHSNDPYKYLLLINGKRTVNGTALQDNNYDAPNAWEHGVMKSVGGHETRPINAYVNYIIKY